MIATSRLRPPAHNDLEECGARPAPLRFKDVVITYDVGPGLRARYLKDRWSLRGPHLVFLAGIPVSVIMKFVITYNVAYLPTSACTQ